MKGGDFGGRVLDIMIRHLRSQIFEAGYRDLDFFLADYQRLRILNRDVSFMMKKIVLIACFEDTCPFLASIWCCVLFRVGVQGLLRAMMRSVARVFFFQRATYMARNGMSEEIVRGLDI